MLFVFGGAFWYYQTNYGGKIYYTKITTDGKVIDVKKMNSDKLLMVDYVYELPAYNKEGEKINTEFQSTIGRRLKKGAYLKLKVNKIKGVLSWEEVGEKDLPIVVKEKLN